MPVGTGQGRASRSIFPDVRVGRSSTTASRGTKGAGSVDRRWARAASCAKPSRTATYPTSTVPPEPVRRTAAAAPVTPGDGEQGTVHLTELDAAAAQLDLVVGAADEQQPRGLVPHQVAAPVGPLPAERRHRRVLLRVLDGVEVAGQPDTTDDQLAHVAVSHRLQVRADDGQVPPVERQPDPYRRRPVEASRAGDHRGLGRTVGVPHLPSTDGQPGRQLRWTRLTAEDQQAHPGQRCGRPQGHQRRNRGHDRDPVGDHPRSEVHAAAHQRPRGRDEARAVGPRQPHLLAGRVEGDGEPCHHPVARADRPVLQEQPSLGVDEGGGAAVLHRHALGPAGRPGREDHPGVVLGSRIRRVVRQGARRADLDDEVGSDQRGHAGLVEHQPRPAVRVVGVHRDVRRAGQQDPEDGHVQVGRPGRYADTHPLPRADARAVQLCRYGFGGLDHLAVGEDVRAAVDRGVVGTPRWRSRGGSPRGFAAGRRGRTAAGSCHGAPGSSSPPRCQRDTRSGGGPRRPR